MSDEANKKIMTISDLKSLLNDPCYDFKDSYVINHFEMTVLFHNTSVTIEHITDMLWTCSQCNFPKKVIEDKRNWICDVCFYKPYVIA